MAAVAVGDVFEDERAVAGTGVVAAVLDGGFHGEDVHAVDFEAGDVLAAFVVVCQGGGAVGGCAHAVFVVYGEGMLLVAGTGVRVRRVVRLTFAAEYYREIP